MTNPAWCARTHKSLVFLLLSMGIKKHRLFFLGDASGTLSLMTRRKHVKHVDTHWVTMQLTRSVQKPMLGGANVLRRSPEHD